MTYRWWMVRVEPIRDIEDIKRLKKNLKERGKFRDLLLFTMGINSALRISDLLKIQVKNVFDENGKVILEKKFMMREKKTKKTMYVYLNNSIEKALKLYAEAYPPVIKKADNYLFFRQKGSVNGLGSDAITPNGAWRLIKQWCKDVNIQTNCWTHTLRKTWGYQMRMLWVDLAVIQHKLNHSSMAITKRYLGITDDEIEDVCMKANL